MDEIEKNVRKVLTGPGYTRWMNTPMNRLHGRTPAQCIEDNDFELVLGVSRSYLDPTFA